MKTVYKLITIVAITFFLLVILWGIHIVPLQLEFIEDCKIKTSNLGLDYEIEFFSYPISNVNGKCWYVNKTIVDITPKQIKENKE